jgi:hypothetical protein
MIDAGMAAIDAKKKQSAMESHAWASWGAAVLRPYMRGCAGDCDKTRWPGGASPAPTKAIS